MQNQEIKTIVIGDNEFEQTDYNGVSVIINKADGYFNGTKMARDNYKQDHFARFLNSDRMANIVKIWKNKHYAKNGVVVKSAEKQELEPFYVLNADIPDKYKFLRGTYIHPQLIHFVAEWCSIEYSFRVADLMDAMNERQHKLQISHEENLKAVIKNLETRAVPNTNKRKKLHIVELSDGKYQVSANQQERRTIIESFTFPAAMNVKQLLKPIIKYPYIFNDEQADEVYRVIEDNITEK